MKLKPNISIFTVVWYQMLMVLGGFVSWVILYKLFDIVIEGLLGTGEPNSGVAIFFGVALFVIVGILVGVISAEMWESYYTVKRRRDYND